MSWKGTPRVMLLLPLLIWLHTTAGYGCTNRLYRGQRQFVGDYLCSRSLFYRLVLNATGQMSIGEAFARQNFSRPPPQTLFTTPSTTKSVLYLTLSESGDLILVATDGIVIWHSNTAGGTYVELQDTGVAVVFAVNDSTGNVSVLWKSDSMYSLRLVGAQDRGRLEVLYNGTWGSVCNDSFESYDANVACRTLGFQSGSVVSNSFGQSTGPIWLTKMKCTGKEDVFQDCPFNDDQKLWAENTCTHAQDVAVQCQGGLLLSVPSPLAHVCLDHLDVGMSLALGESLCAGNNGEYSLRFSNKRGDTVLEMREKGRRKWMIGMKGQTPADSRMRLDQDNIRFIGSNGAALFNVYPPTTVVTGQWAQTATATSSAGTSWIDSHVAGFCDLSGWSAGHININDALIITVRNSICVSSIVVYEYVHTGLVAGISAMSPNGTWDRLWTGSATYTNIGYITLGFSPALAAVNYTTNQFKIDFYSPDPDARPPTVDCVQVFGTSACVGVASQWAQTASATSAYSGYEASRAAGSFNLAGWSASRANTNETLSITVANSIYISSMVVYEHSYTGLVTGISALSPAGTWDRLWTGSSSYSFIGNADLGFSPALAAVPYTTNQFKIDFYSPSPTTQIPEVDCVQVFGTSASPGNASQLELLSNGNVRLTTSNGTTLWTKAKEDLCYDESTKLYDYATDMDFTQGISLLTCLDHCDSNVYCKMVLYTDGNDAATWSNCPKGISCCVTKYATPSSNNANSSVYEKIPGCGSGLACYVAYPGVETWAYGISQPAASTVQDCVAQCDSTPTCNNILWRPQLSSGNCTLKWRRASESWNNAATDAYVQRPGCTPAVVPRQWAQTASATSYAGTGWFGSNAAGSCDFSAWSAGHVNINDVLTITVQNSICISSMIVNEYVHTGLVASISAMSPNGTWDPLWSGSSTYVYIGAINKGFSPPLAAVNYTTNQFKIDFYSSSPSTQVPSVDCVQVFGSSVCPSAQQVVTSSSSSNAVTNQWAQTASATSAASGAAWVSSHAAGSCDFSLWSAGHVNINDVLTITVQNSICISSMVIYESYHTGLIAAISAMSPNGTWDRLWSGSSTYVYYSSSISLGFSPALAAVNYTTNQFKIDFYSSDPNAHPPTVDCVLMFGSSVCASAQPVVASSSSSSSNACTNKLYANHYLLPGQKLCSANGQHVLKVGRDGHVDLDGGKWTAGVDTGRSALFALTDNYWLRMFIDDGSFKGLSNPQSQPSLAPGYCVLSDDGKLRVVNGNGIEMWNHVDGSLSTRNVVYPATPATALLLDGDNATCLSSMFAAEMGIEPIGKNATIKLSVVGRRLQCSMGGGMTPYHFRLSAGSERSFGSMVRFCPLTSSSSTQCQFECRCEKDLCDKVTLIRATCPADEDICEVVRL